MTIPTNYTDLLSNRLLLITGVGRSGTTILGKLLGSCSLSYYLFEPAIMKYSGNSSWWDWGTIMEDYFIPQIQGRNINTRFTEDSWIGNYEHPFDHRDRNILLPRHDNVIEYIKLNRPLFIIKSPEMQEYISQFTRYSPEGTKTLEIVRNGYDVIQSSLKRGWFTDDWLPIEVCYTDTNIPCYIPKRHVVDWGSYTPTTRAALTWTTLTGSGMLHRDQPYYRWLRYETLCALPEDTIHGIIKWIGGIHPTTITATHLHSVQVRGTPQTISLSDIQPPVRQLFTTTMEELGYDI